MEGREVDRYIGAEFFDDPLRELFQLLLRIILAGNEQGRDLEPNIRVMLEIDERVEHRLKASSTQLLIEAFGESFEIDVRRIHVSIEFRAWLLTDIAGGHRNGSDARFPAPLRDIDGILMKDGGIVIGKRYAPQPSAAAVRAIVSGEAASASVSISRDLLMSQF